MRLLWAIFAAPALVALPLVAAPGNDGLPRGSASRSARDDLERAARDYRIAVYATFRQNRPEFERRTAAGRDVLAGWKADGEREEKLPEMLAWFHDAALASRAGRVRELPPLPDLGRLADRSGPTEPTQPNVLDRAAETRRSAPPPVQARSVEPSAPPLARRTTESVSPARSADASALPAVPLPVSPGVSKLPRPPIADAADVAATADVPPRRAAPPAPIELPDARPPARPEVAQTPPPAATEGIDVAEVAVRVAGHNLALATLGEELRKLENPTVEQLAAHVERLEALAVRASDLSPYFALVGESDRNRLRPLAPLDDAGRLLGDRIERAIATIAADQTLPAVTRAERLARLAELQRRLAQLLNPAS